MPTPASPAAVTIPVGGPAEGSPAEANQFARKLLARIRPPAGSRLVTSPSAELAGPAVSWQLDPMTDVGAVWRVPLPVDGAATYFKRDPPAGLMLLPSADNSQITGIVNENVSDALDFGHRPVPTGIWGAQVVLTMLSDGPAATFVRADVQVVWYPPRSRAEYIGGLHVMTISGPQGSRTFTSPAVIARMAGLLNALPTAQGTSCSGQNVAYDLAFAVKRGAAPWTVATVGPSCPGVGMTVDNQDQPTLADPSGMIVSYIATLLE
jgi:hypothetical protein